MRRQHVFSCALLSAVIWSATSGFTADQFSLSKLKNYKKEFKSVSIGACSTSSTKTYEDYRLITSVGSAQYQYIHNHCTVDEETGFLIDEDLATLGENLALPAFLETKRTTITKTLEEL